jgi:AcrR family transcriptional regulator
MSRRPSNEDPSEILLETANRLFFRDGINCTGISRLVTEAGVARKTLYERFGSKENLLKAVLERDGREWMAWFTRRVDALPGNPQERLLGIFDVLQEWFSQEEFYGCSFINTVAEQNKIDSPFRQMALQHRSAIKNILEQLADTMGLRDPGVLADQLNLLIDGATVTAMLTRSPESARQAKEIAERLIATYVGPSSRQRRRSRRAREANLEA